MKEYVDAYKILSDACVAFCEEHFYYDDIVAKIYTDVLGDYIIYCVCNENCHFDFIRDWYEGGSLTIIALEYFDALAERGFAK